jgi:23S rRNA pseudouridine2605 synthase
VSVNGTTVQEMGTRVDPERDVVTVDGERVTSPKNRRTVMLHKPRGVVSTLADPEGRPTVRDLVPEHLYPIGRLDLQSAGLLLLTNDGALAARLIHPRAQVPRVYHAKVRGAPGQEAITRLTHGVRLADGFAAVAKARVLERRPTKTWLEVTVHEGRQHIVRRLCDAVGHPVEKLVRVRLGPLTLGDLPIGAWRELLPRELAALATAAGLKPAVGAAAPKPRAPGTRPSRPRGPKAAPRRDVPRGARPDAAAKIARARRPRPKPRRP